MTWVAIGDDWDERIVRVDVDPSGPGVFDHVLQTAHISCRRPTSRSTHRVLS
jgi:hypothetical protein